MKLKRIIIYFILLVVIIILFDRVLMPLYVGKNEVKVPSVLGMTYEQAMKVLQNVNLQPTYGGERYDSKYPKGTIILQRPIANKMVKEGRRIYLIVSGGNIKVEVPKITYKKVEEASFLLNRNGLTLGDIFEDTTSDVPSGLITSQSIAPGEMVEKGTSISIWVSYPQTDGNIEVPDVKGMSLSEAKKLIESKNLRLGKIIYQPSIEYLPNTVLYQSPSSGVLVQESTSIDLIVVKEKITGKEIIE